MSDDTSTSWVSVFNNTPCYYLILECTRRKQSRNASYSSQFNPPPEESVPDCNYSEYTTPSCNSSSRTHAPNSNTMRGSIQAGYNQPTNGRAYGNSNGVVSNPYKNNRAQNTYNRQSFKPPADASNGNYGMQNATAGKPHRHQYASEMLNKISPEYTQEEGKKYATQHPHRGGHVRTQRQFGTAVSLSSNSTSRGTDNGLGDVVSTTSANVQYAESASRHVAKGMSATASADDFSDTSSSSSDDDIISFAIFGNKK